MQQQPRKKSSAFTVGCVLIVALTLCGAVISIGRSIAGDTGSTPTPTDTVAAISQDVATQAPTDQPTIQPTPTDTPISVAQVQPTQPPPPQPTPTPVPHCSGVNGNPWCYDFSSGKLIYNPPSGFCSYFNCIASFVEPDDPGDGYVVECQDSTYSQSGGESGACSRHGGVLRPLYAH